MPLRGVRRGGELWSKDVYFAVGIFSLIPGSKRSRRLASARSAGKPESFWLRANGAGGIPITFEAGTSTSNTGARGRGKRPCGLNKT
jgi:hypothetical protein